MSSPFPGMNPYLEEPAIWPLFHQQLITALYQILLPGLVDRYRSRLVPRQYVCEMPLFTSVVREEHREETIEIRHRSDGRLITLIDVVSPANKATESGRQAYLQRRRSALAEHANLAEIDLVLQGKMMVDYPVEDLAERDYGVVVTRANQPNRPDHYPCPLQKRLPKFRLPMAGDDKEVIVDLHTTFLRSFEQGSFAEQLDYSRDPTTKLAPEKLEWLDAFLRQQKLRA
jgi:Protein of unknown function (DUF4058)